MSEYTILIADDHPLLRSAVVQSLRQSLPLAQVREVASAEALAEALDAHPDVDLVLLDLTMPGAHGFPRCCTCAARIRTSRW
jgi:DNA-binding NarL/FixJ family response regulator